MGTSAGAFKGGGCFIFPNGLLVAGAHTPAGGGRGPATPWLRAGEYLQRLTRGHRPVPRPEFSVSPASGPLPGEPGRLPR